MGDAKKQHLLGEEITDQIDRLIDDLDLRALQGPGDPDDYRGRIDRPPIFVIVGDNNHIHMPSGMCAGCPKAAQVLEATAPPALGVAG